jgi:hypothetical protein
MACIVIRARDGRVFQFSAPGAGGYVRVSVDRQPGKQICHGGAFLGPTLTALPESLPSVARRWYRAFRRRERATYGA